MIAKTLIVGLAVCLLIVSAVFVFAEEELIATIGTVSGDAPAERTVQEGILLWKERLRGYEPIWKVYRHTTTCEPLNVTCVPEEKNRTIISTTEHGRPLYEKVEVTASNVSGRLITRHQDRVGCFVCPTDHTRQVCYAYDDGFSDHLAPEWQCTCKSGTSCKVVDLTTDQTMYSRTDGGAI